MEGCGRTEFRKGNTIWKKQWIVWALKERRSWKEKRLEVERNNTYL
jgi:hypothetical protein